MKAILRGARISPYKVQAIAELIRGKRATDALIALKFLPKKAGGLLYKGLHSAISNAENNLKLDRDQLMVSKIMVTKGVTLKRGLPVSRGRWHPIFKRTSHITIEVEPMTMKQKLAVRKASTAISNISKKKAASTKKSDTKQEAVSTK